MTNETGSRRHPAGKIRQIPVPENMAPVQQPFDHHRLPDAVRAVALTLAVQAYPEATTGELIAVAEDFTAWLQGPEAWMQYLTGEEADGDVGPHPFIDSQPPSPVKADGGCLLITAPGRICGKRRSDPAHEEADG